MKFYQRNPSAFTKAWDLLIVIPPKSIHITTGCISFSLNRNAPPWSVLD